MSDNPLYGGGIQGQDNVDNPLYSSVNGPRTPSPPIIQDEDMLDNPLYDS